MKQPQICGCTYQVGDSQGKKSCGLQCQVVKPGSERPAIQRPAATAPKQL